MSSKKSDRPINQNPNQSSSNTFGPDELSTQPSSSGDGSNVELPIEFGRYRLLKQLGTGGMGTVYLAHDTELDRKVALKLPHTNGTRSKLLSDRFRREARLAATLDHPNICRIFDIGEHDGRQFLTMAYVEGRSLHEIIKATGAIEPRTAVQLMQGIATTVHFAHEQGIIHRDLKPANIMIKKDKSFVIMDFGLARRINQEDEQLTAVGAVLGTPAYMSPEQLRNEENEVGSQSDIYSLGIILNELLLGRRPFHGSVPQIYTQILTSDSVAPSAMDDGIDLAICSICRSATHRHLKKRYGSAKDFADALGHYLAQETQPVDSVSMTFSSGKNNATKPSLLEVVDPAPFALPKPIRGVVGKKLPSNGKKRIRRSSPIGLRLLTYAAVGIIAGCIILLFPNAKRIAKSFLFGYNDNFLSYAIEKHTGPKDEQLENTASPGAEKREASTTTNELAKPPKPDNKADLASTKSTDNLIPNQNTSNGSVAPSQLNAASQNMPAVTADPKSSSQASGPPNSDKLAQDVDPLDNWKTAMKQARDAIRQLDFETFQSKIGLARSTSSSTEQSKMHLRLSQMGNLYQNRIKKLQQARVGTIIQKDRSQFSKPVTVGLKVTKVSSDFVVLRTSGKETTFRWEALMPHLARQIVDWKDTDPEEVAAWAVFSRLYRERNQTGQSFSDEATIMFAASVGKGNVRSDLEMAFTDNYDTVKVSMVENSDTKVKSGNVNRIVPTLSPNLNFIIPPTQRTFWQVEEFNTVRPFSKLNEPYCENSFLSIRSDSGAFHWNAKTLAENQLVVAKVRVRNEESGSVGVILSTTPGHGVSTWIDGSGIVTIGPSLNSTDKKGMKSNRFSIENGFFPAGSWNNVAYLKKGGVASIFINDVKITDVDLEVDFNAVATLSLGILSSSRGTIVDMDSITIYNVR